MSTRAGSAVDAQMWPRFTATPETAHVLGSRLGAGVALGATRSGKHASIALLQPLPVRVVVVGPAWIACLLAIRGACLGASVTILTDRPAPWAALTRAVGGRAPFATLMAPEGASLPAPTVAEPLLVLHDGSARGAETAVARGPWHTSVHLLFRLVAQSSTLLDAADLILLPQPPPEELDSALELLRLPPAIADQVTRMDNTEFLAVTRGRALFVRIRATPTETELLHRR